MVRRHTLKRKTRRRAFERNQKKVLHPIVRPSLHDQECRKWSTAKALKSIGAPRVLIRLCLLFITKVAIGEPHFDQIEYMAGKHACTRAAWDRGKHAFPYEIKRATPLHGRWGAEGEGGGVLENRLL